MRREKRRENEGERFFISFRFVGSLSSRFRRALLSLSDLFRLSSSISTRRASRELPASLSFLSFLSTDRSLRLRTPQGQLQHHLQQSQHLHRHLPPAPTLSLALLVPPSAVISLALSRLDNTSRPDGDCSRGTVLRLRSDYDSAVLFLCRARL